MLLISDVFLGQYWHLNFVSTHIIRFVHPKIWEKQIIVFTKLENMDGITIFHKKELGQ